MDRNRVPLNENETERPVIEALDSAQPIKQLLYVVGTGAR